MVRRKEGDLSQGNADELWVPCYPQAPLWSLAWKTVVWDIESTFPFCGTHPGHKWSGFILACSSHIRRKDNKTPYCVPSMCRMSLWSGEDLFQDQVYTAKAVLISLSGCWSYEKLILPHRNHVVKLLSSKVFPPSFCCENYSSVTNVDGKPLAFFQTKIQSHLLNFKAHPSQQMTFIIPDRCLQQKLCLVFSSLTPARANEASAMKQFIKLQVGENR